LWTKVHGLFSSNVGGVVDDQLLFRFSICGSVSEKFAIKVESCQKSQKILDGFFALPIVLDHGQHHSSVRYAARYDDAIGFLTDRDAEGLDTHFRQHSKLTEIQQYQYTL